MLPGEREGVGGGGGVCIRDIMRHLSACSQEVIHWGLTVALTIPVA